MDQWRWPLAPGAPYEGNDTVGGTWALQGRAKIKTKACQIFS